MRSGGRCPLQDSRTGAWACHLTALLPPSLVTPLSCCTCHQSGKLHLQVISPICILFIAFAIPGCCNSLLIRLPISTFVLYSLHAHCNQRLLNMDKRLGTQTPVRTNKLLIATDTVHFPWVCTVLSPYIHSTVLCLHIGGLLCARSPALPCPAIRW